MKWLVIPLLGVFFVTLIAGSTQSVTADHLEPGQGIYKDENSVNYVSTKDSKYQIHIQVQVRNEQGQLVSISEDSIGRLIPHELTDHVFNEKLDEIEIVTTDNIKYERVQYADYIPVEELMTNSQTSHFIGLWRIIMCGEVVGHGHPCLPIFQINTSHVFITEGDVVTLHWTILRIIN